MTDPPHLFPDPLHVNRSLLSLMVACLLAGLLAGCASPRLQEDSGNFHAVRLGAEEAIMDDGYRLPLRHWGDSGTAMAMVLALHGFNDYGNGFSSLGRYLAERGVLTYAFDQRGFGATDQRGSWAGEDRMTADLRTLTELLRERHPELPLYLMGESMGGAVVMAGTGSRADGIVLIAPAVWSRNAMNPLQRFALWATAHTLPWLRLTGDGLHIRPSDNLDMLRELSADPLVIKGTRVDALWGVTNMMDRASASTGRLSGPTLLLYGERDEVIPRGAFCRMVEKLPEYRKGIRVVLYKNGWHMLTRDLQGERVLADVAAWLADPRAPLPSGEETAADANRLERFCDGESS